jgi:hypothetical protein
LLYSVTYLDTIKEHFFLSIIVRSTLQKITTGLCLAFFRETRLCGMKKWKELNLSRIFKKFLLISLTTYYSWIFLGKWYFNNSKFYIRNFRKHTTWFMSWKYELLCRVFKTLDDFFCSHVPLFFIFIHNALSNFSNYSVTSVDMLCCECRN